jgi:CubicO group peptidase (beta-lactamase class C family)
VLRPSPPARPILRGAQRNFPNRRSGADWVPGRTLLAGRMQQAAGRRQVSRPPPGLMGWIPSEDEAERRLGGGLLRRKIIPVGRILAAPAKVLCSAIFISGRDCSEALAHSCFINDGICTLIADDDLALADLVDVEVDRAGRSVSMSMALTAATVPRLIKSYLVKYPDLRNADWVTEEQRLLAVGIVTRTARQSGGGQGCHILPQDGTGPHFTPTAVQSALPPAGTMPWPMGDVISADVGAAPAEARWNTAAECAFADPDAHTAAFLVLHRGKIVAERYAPGIDMQTQLESWSMGKSLTATLIGQLLQEGGDFTLDSPAPVAAWAHDQRKNILVRDLLQMSSGLRFSGFDSPNEEWDHGRPDHALMYSEAIDCFKWATSRPAEHPPQVVGRYRNCDPLTLGYLLRRAAEAKAVAAAAAAGRTLSAEERQTAYLRYPQAALFDRLGIREQVLETDLWGNFIMSGFDYGTARNWARLGLLYAQDGVWGGGTRILPRGFVDFVSAPAPAWSEPKYGGHFWVNGTRTFEALPPTAFSMNGAGGQWVIVDREHQLVIVRMGHRKGGQGGRALQSLNHALAALVHEDGDASPLRSSLSPKNDDHPGNEASVRSKL